MNNIFLKDCECTFQQQEMLLSLPAPFVLAEILYSNGKTEQLYRRVYTPISDNVYKGCIALNEEYLINYFKKRNYKAIPVKLKILEITKERDPKLTPRKKKVKHHYIYIISLTENVLYVGYHSTNDLFDGYCGSSGVINYLKKELGINFLRSSCKKLILKDYNNKKDAQQAEEYLIRTMSEDQNIQLLNKWRDSSLKKKETSTLKKIFNKGKNINEYYPMIWK